MGIDLHNLRFLAHARDLGVRFDSTVGIGRQVVFVEPRELASHARERGLPPLSLGAPAYFEPLMRQWLGAQRVDAVDASPYEQASLIHDMNLPWPAASASAGAYDAVLDFGCLEHVFDFPTAWRNCVALCRPGGHLLHALPANNLAGHGFYQFSPELFANLYQPARGFELRAMFYAMKAEPRSWFRVANPLQVKRRVNLANGHETYLLVLAKKLVEAPAALPPPQQSDYAQGDWVGQGAAAPSASRWQAPLATLGLLDAARRWRERLRALRGAGLSLPGPDYERVDLSRLLSR